MSAVLVINSGSSSFKYQLIDMQTETELASGLVERIGEASGHARHTAAGSDRVEQTLPIPDHTAGFAVMLAAFAASGPQLSTANLVAVGHRVVQGGSIFQGPTVIDDEVLAQISALSDLAPLHNPAHVQGINAARAQFPDVPHVAVFDTSFHQTMPAPAYTYAIDTALAAEYGIRRYGAHGSSHKFVSEAAAEFLGRPLAELKTIVLHLGNGASACAVDGGKSIDTSMGLTPLQGLVMGTRSGDIDPAVLFHLHRKAGMSIEELDTLLNKKSGMLGLTGNGDMRDVEDAAIAGDAVAQAALDVYYHRIRGYVGNYIAQLGGLDVIVFTAGIGENSGIIRAGALAGLEFLGIEIDPAKNDPFSRVARVISTDDSKVTVLVIPTNEELEIARQTLAVI
ncbi:MULTISPECIES: acetate/propionate family kinase [unclassified Cryobacterium]|uniref:acetate/propionate family kinase n=1 Tax=unclassified Cryobacterium TaxID=2649013 RepID=UPI0010692F9D|nr:MULTISPECIES: acetate kinase [unclassified Cryobacterium]MDY7529161.1 acetate kinase [Cryobacterium sp. 10C2]MEB0003283.1 acetate kinase [Cryobacterium sp. RTC2.1]MEB0201884.1 acetate kinase [Cryobacterium sp. 5I3]MEB0287743.1 acetate kinase [Cryobacterium sp. 10S3]MEB0290564.1 acetate kinase [Cryobacterium sp. 10C2]